MKRLAALALMACIAISMFLMTATSHARPIAHDGPTARSCPKIQYYTKWETEKTKVLPGNMIKKWQYRWGIREPCSDVLQNRVITVYNYG